jgi:hypothetical protein
MNPLRTPLEALGFVVDFAQMDLGQASPAQLKAAERRVRQLSSITMDRPNRFEWASHRSWPAIPRAEFERLHADARRLLTGLAMSGEGTVNVRLMFSTPRALSSFRLSTGRAVYLPALWLEVNGSPRDLFLYRVIRLLDELGSGKLHTCPEPKCGRLFFKRTRKEYCSTLCQSRAYMRGYREKSITTKRTGRLHGKTRTK